MQQSFIELLEGLLLGKVRADFDKHHQTVVPFDLILPEFTERPVQQTVFIFINKRGKTTLSSFLAFYS